MSAHFIEIPPKYQENINSFSNENEVIKTIYSNFDFLYFPYSQIEIENGANNNIINNDLNNLDTYLFDFLKEYKFIIFNIAYLYENNNNTPNNQDLLHHEYICNLKFDSKSSSSYIVDAIICVEGKCLIIERISYLSIIKIMKKIESSVLNITTIFKNYESTEAENQAKQEITNFCQDFQKIIFENLFMTFTIQPIVGYLIRRYFYPCEYFKDPSFFTFDSIQQEEPNRNVKFNDFFFSRNIKEIPGKLALFFHTNSEQINRREFKESEFIKLRLIYSNENAFFYMAIHLESLYIFMLKCFNSALTEMTNEINFCNNFSHRCFVPFYGFLKDKDTINGMLYEFMSND